MEIGSAVVTAIIHAASGGAPDDLVGTLTVATPPDSGAEQTVTFTAPSAGIDLAANTLYFFMLDSTSNNVSTLQNTASESEDSGAASGWSIANNSIYRDCQSNGVWTSYAESKKIAINGWPLPLPLVSLAVSKSIAEGAQFSHTVRLSELATENVTVKVRGRRTDGTVLTRNVVILASTRGTPPAFPYPGNNQNTTEDAFYQAATTRHADVGGAGQRLQGAQQPEREWHDEERPGTR